MTTFYFFLSEVAILCKIFAKIDSHGSPHNVVNPADGQMLSWIQFVTSTPIHARAWKEKALAGYNSQQIPTKNDIHKMLIIIISSIGRPFRPLLWWWWKNGGPSASGRHLGWPHFRFRKWGHPRWRPEAEGSPFSTTTTIGIEKAAPSLGWRHFRRRHLESKMAAPHITSGGRRDVIQTSAPSMSPVDVWLYFLVRLKK